MSANLGSLEIMGHIANGAKYGMRTNHRYWTGAIRAIPAMLFLGVFMVRYYYEVLQFFLIVVGFLPLSFIGLHEVGGWKGLVAKLL